MAGTQTAFELSLYRIAQELTNNLLKRADATQAVVQVSRQADTLSLTIEDNAKGLEVENKKDGTGLSSICKRVGIMHGHMELTSEPGKGTSIYLEFDIKPELTHSI